MTGSQTSAQPRGDTPPATTRSARVRRAVREWVVTIAMVAAVLLPLRSSVADWHDVPTGSMRPTILEGDRIWVNKLAYGLRLPFTTTWLVRWNAPDRGDIVTLASPRDGRRLVKRVIGLPGDRISMSGNRLTVNGVPVAYDVLDPAADGWLPDGTPARVVLAREHLPGRGAEGGGAGGRGVAMHPIVLTPSMSGPSSFREIVVPEGHYFVMGDNRDQSLDSRLLGFVPEKHIYGRTRYVAISLDRSNFYLPRLGRFFSQLP